jgi:dephospho-CoA kinase
MSAQLTGAVRPLVLTGGIGSGKSTVGSLLSSWGAYLVDADQLARDVVAPGTEGRAAVESLLGPEVVAPDGSLDRAAIAELVFADAGLLSAVEQIIHPLVHAAGQMLFAEAPEDSVRVYEVPLPGRSPFTETPLVVVVDAPDDIRRQRLLARGMSDDQITARMQSQPSRTEWLALADVVIDNSGSASELGHHVATLWRRVTGADPPVGPGD